VVSIGLLVAVITLIVVVEIGRVALLEVANVSVVSSVTDACSIGMVAPGTDKAEY